VLIVHVAATGSLTSKQISIKKGSANLEGWPQGNGRGIFNLGKLTLEESTVSGNISTYGGGIYNYLSTATLTNSTVSGNTANENGGGIYNFYNSTATLENTIFAGNHATSSPDCYNDSTFNADHYNLFGGDGLECRRI